MKKILILIAVAFLSIPSFAQNDLGTIDDYGRVSLTPVLPELGSVPAHAQKMLLSKLHQVAAKNGIGGVAIQPQFIITATVDVVSKDITSTAPPMVAMNIEVQMYIIDYKNKKIFSSLTLGLKGAGKTDTKAYISAIKRINPRSSKVRSFVKKGKNKIIEYYNTQCDFIIKEAQTLRKQQKYEDAINKLITIPEICQECYFKALDAIDPIYKEMIGITCKDDITAAREALDNNNIDGAKKYLLKVQPGTDCYDTAVDMAKEINKKMTEEQSTDASTAPEQDEFVLQATAPATREEKVAAYKKVAQDYNSKNSEEEEYNLNFINNKN